MKMSKSVAWLLTLCMIFAIIPNISLAAEHDAKMTTKNYYYGDVNVDDMINTGDATLVLKHCSDAEGYILQSGTLSYILADANVNGVVNTADATYILRICADLEVPNIYQGEIYEKFNVKYASGLDADEIVILPANEEAMEMCDYEIKAPATHSTYTFSGWLADFNGQVYNVGDKFTMPSQDITLTATWNGIVVPTEAPTETPTETPTEEPTQQPTDATVKFTMYDSFNEVVAGDFEQTIPANTTTLSIANIQLPTGYRFVDPYFSISVTVTNGIATPSSVNLQVYPYQMIDSREFKVIYTLKGFMKIQNNLDGCYVLGNDIDMSPIENFMPFGWDWNNVDNPETYFTGVFDGNGYKVTSLRIFYIVEFSDDGQTYSQYTNVGLFSINNGTIRNVSVYTRDFTGDENYGVYGDINVGIIAGYNMTNIENCHAYGNVGSYDFLSYQYTEQSLGAVGGICGTNGKQGRVRQSSFEGGVEGFFAAGGIAGKNFGTVEECYFAGGMNWDVEVEFMQEWGYMYMIGGLCGGMQGGTLKNSYAYLTYDVRGFMGVGGLLGWVSGGRVEDCYVYGAQHILSVESGGIYIGYTNSPASTMGLYNYAEFSGLPSSYSTLIWDLNGASNRTMPDLINNRRGNRFYDAIGD